MINFLLKNPSLYRLYQKTVRGKYDEYDFIKFIFSKEIFKNIRMLDICCGDSYILEHINEFVDDYMGVDNNDKYLKQCKLRWKNFNFMNLILNKEIYLPIILFVIFMLISAIIKKKIFDDKN